jgi:hypothetical protein
MLNTLSDLFRKRSSVNASAVDTVDVLRADTHIIVPQTAFDAWPENPAPLVQAVVNFVNHMSRQGRYTRNELSMVATQVFHCDFYQAQVVDGGHTKLIANSGPLLEFVLSDILHGLKEMGALDYLMLARRVAQWVLDNPEEAQSEAQYEDGVSEPLHALDAPFLDLMQEKPLTALIADWIAKYPGLRVVADDDLPEHLGELVGQNPKLADRNDVLAVNRLHLMLVENPNVHFATAVGAMPQPELLIAVGNGLHMEIEGKQRMTFVLRTSVGLRWCAVCDEGTAIYEHIAHDNDHMPDNPFEATKEDLAKWKAPDVGKRLVFVPEADIAALAMLAERVCAPAAVHLLMQQVENAEKVDFVTIIGTSTDDNGMAQLNLMLSIDGHSGVLSAQISENHGALLDPETGETLVQLDADAILSHAAATSVESLT